MTTLGEAMQWAILAATVGLAVGTLALMVLAAIALACRSKRHPNTNRRRKP